MNEKQFWLMYQFQPLSPAYNIPSLFFIQGKLDISAVETSINTIIERHEIFRTSFTDRDGSFNRQIAPSGSIKIESADLRDKTANERESSCQDIIKEATSRPFDLGQSPLLRAHIVGVQPDEYLLLIVFHHIVADLHTKNLFATELSALYNHLVSSAPSPDLSHPIPYSDHINWRQNWIQSTAAKAMHRFWQEEHAGRENLLDLPLDFQRPVVFKGIGAARDFTFDQDLTSKLHPFGKKRSVDIFVILLSAYAILLYRYTRQHEITIGVPLTNRRRKDDKDIMGCFINILPLAFSLEDEMAFEDVILQVRKKMLMAHRNQEISFDEIVSVLQPKRDPSYNPIFQAGFTVEPAMELQLNELEVKSEKIHNDGAQLDIFLNFSDTTAKIQGYFEYNTEIFLPSTIERFCNHYRNLLHNIITSAPVTISRLDILSTDEKEQLLRKWNDTAVDYGPPQCLQKVFQDQVARTPHATAIEFGNEQLTYQELNDKANQLAHFLREHKIVADEAVGIFMERSIEMVVAIYGIIKAGGAYVPLDPDFPEQRLHFILAETKAKVLLTQSHLQAKAPQHQCVTLYLDTEWHQLESFPRTNPDFKMAANNLAYIIYTSGSTGTPKGVMNEHRGIHNRLVWMQDAFRLQPDDKVLQKTPYSFDVSVWEFFWPLLVGARLIIAPPGVHKDPIKLAEIIRQSQITTLHFVPSMLRLFLESGVAGTCISLKKVLCSGEALPWELQDSFFTNLSCELHNLYGPTEAAVDVSHWKCDAAKKEKKVPIGYPIANTQLYILDQNLSPVPLGTTGELYIGGIQVARGYLNRPELNETHFIADPFSELPGARLYKTGDRARYLPDGAIEYLGRIDFQIKLLGNRIEPGEIEKAITSHTDVKDAVVTVYTTPQGNQQLLAYVISAAPDIQSLSLRKYLSGHIPSYMIPSAFIQVKEFGLTSSGKIDRKSLPEPDFQQTAKAPLSPMKQSDLSKHITAIWQRILEDNTIEADDNFFEVGGNSLLAIQLSAELERELNTAVQLVKIFQYPTINLLAEFLGSKLNNALPETKINTRAQLQQKALANRRKHIRGIR